MKKDAHKVRVPHYSVTIGKDPFEDHLPLNVGYVRIIREDDVEVNWFGGPRPKEGYFAYFAFDGEINYWRCHLSDLLAKLKRQGLVNYSLH